MAIARRILEAALAAGIPQEDIYIDCLTLTASAQQEDVLADAAGSAHRVRRSWGYRRFWACPTSASACPAGPYLNTTFLTMAMYAGLDLAIMNPSSEEMMAAVYAYNVLTNRDKQSGRYIARYADQVPASAALAKAMQDKAASGVPAAAEAAGPAVSGPYAPLMKAVEQGLKGEAAACTKALLAEKEPLELVDEALIPALDIVGVKYEKGQALPAAAAAGRQRGPERF